MSARDLQQLLAWSSTQAADRTNPAGERRLWRQIAREVTRYEGTPTSTPGGVPVCSVCREPGGRHRSLASGRYVSEHDESEGPAVVTALSELPDVDDVDPFVLEAEGGLLSLEDAALRVGVSVKAVKMWVRRRQVLAVLWDGQVWLGEQSLLECERARRRTPQGRPRRVS